jgi:Zn-finger nucleic acid-binding protein
MREREKGDVIIDICPQCRGVWLDAGELDKLSEREQRYYDDDDDHDWRDRGAGRYEGRDRPQRRQGFLANLMEGFGGDD